MKLFDTLRSRSLEFPDHPNDRVGIYACGGTVHGSPPLGHLRSAVNVDVLRRWLIHTGYDVLLVRNVTDIDDKILAKSREAGRPWWEWAATYEREFSAAFDLVGCLPPSVEPRATGHMTEMIELIERLIAAGHAYQSAATRDVYFEVAGWATYGTLSHQDPASLGQDGAARVPGKRWAGDFTLWKAAKPGEPSWPSPWGRGRPSWHVECSAMSTRYLGSTFDLHAGGRDLIFPHHENERAQSTAAGDDFARHWMHNGWVTAAGQKMSKSLGNGASVSEVLSTVRPVELRYYVLAPHYRSTIEYSSHALSEAAQSYRRVERFLGHARQRLVTSATPARQPQALPERFRAALDDDLATPTAIEVIHTHVRAGRAALAEGDNDAVAALARDVRAMLGVLALEPPPGGADPGSGVAGSSGPSDRALRGLVDVLLKRRDQARRTHEYATADTLRDILAEAGVVVRDGASGTDWEMTEPRPQG